MSEVSLSTFFAGVRDGKLTALKCTACNALAIPPKAFCESCGKPLKRADLIGTFNPTYQAERDARVAAFKAGR